MRRNALRIFSLLTPHPIATGVSSLPFDAGSYVSTAPASATMLGFVDDLPVMGTTPFGSGTIFFLGDMNGLEGVPQPLVDNLLAYMLSGAQLVNVCPFSTILWIGLRNSDDQGTQFDLLAEVLQNGTPVASGLNRCITGTTRNPSLAKRVSLLFDFFTPGTMNSGDVLA